ncbi:bifunctional protein-serine/threonine kinase/phosphatase [Parathalassolituus penaei]|uniref:Bifunctional protein-serine/threonine kinase/phosphatase n=1 Tax=Parathalassolituus penaei TaxID=2997323 RepID=A0A9X3EFA2_9GAMM|nr:bifunctional protein-serine/threonine kinase/phosphatase [Parathalassolituus penaei]MCY0966543.1 bifunctional protein-serine/threonine kinase/phosphatase [Parathalassolituus penaei]
MANNSLDVQFGGISVAGKKPINQDAFAVYQPTLSVVRFKGIGVAVADGVSSSENSQQASSTSVTHFLQDYYSTPDSWDVKTAAGKVLSALNSWLYHHGQQASARHNGLVTTFSGMILKSRTAHVFHAGDSRIYHFRGGNLEQITRDHVHNMGGRQALSRAMGMDTRLEVDYLQRDLQVGDLFLISTDGVHGYLPHNHMRDALASLGEESTQRQIEQVCQQLQNDALAAGSDDNLTCVILRVKDLPSSELEEMQRSARQRVIPPVLEEGSVIDHFQVKKVIHANNRSYLYKVVSKRDGKTYALKAPSINFEDDPAYLEGFAREQWIGSRLDHPNLMKIWPQQENSQFLYHLCEWLEGISLRQWMHDHPHADLQQVRAITDQIILGLRGLQRAGMVHRDMKPENVILTEDGRVKIIDYGTVSVKGLAELGVFSLEDVPVGSVNYIAPEYVVDNVATSQSDLFSLAVMVYEMLAGALPFDMEHVYRRGAKSVSEWKYKPLRSHRPDLPLWLDLALQKAMHPSVRQRYEAFSEFRTDLFQPNESLLALHTRQPLMQRDPLIFWQAVSVIWATAALVEGWWILSHM